MCTSRRSRILPYPLLSLASELCLLWWLNGLRTMLGLKMLHLNRREPPIADYVIVSTGNKNYYYY